MKTYAKSIRVLLLITVVSFAPLLCCDKCSKIYDIDLAIFGSSIITLIVSCIGYRVERQKTLETFYNCICKRLSYISSYICSWDTEKKVQFFINHFLKDFEDINVAYANIYFFWDFRKNKKYIREKIYSPCKSMIDQINNRYPYFATYINGTGMSKRSIESDIKSIEGNLYKTSGKTSTQIFINSIMNELNNRFIKIIYGNKKMKKNDF